MKNILPMGEPIVRAYGNHAHIFSILSAKSTQYLPWVYNYYIQLYVPCDYREFKVDYIIPSIYTYAPNLFVSRLERNMVRSNGGEIVDFIKFCIENGYYIYTLLDVKKIKAYEQTYFKNHDPLLYGYDDEKREIYFADTFLNGKYGYGVASYEEVAYAFGTKQDWGNWNQSEWVLDIRCMKYKDLDVRFRFNRDMYVNLLFDYLDGEDSYDKYWNVQGWEKGPQITYMCGIEIYTFIQEYLRIRKERGKRLDQRGFFVIWEHKNILNKTLIYIWGEQWNITYPVINELLQTAIKTAAIMLKLCLKYNISMDKIIINRIDECARFLKDIEKELFTSLIYELSKNKTIF